MPRTFVRVAAAFVMLCAVIVAGPAQALVVLPADLDELARSARAIVYGRVTSVRVELAGDRRHVDTLVSLEASSYLKGDFGPQVTFRVPGGAIGRYRSVIVGAPTFAPGDEVVLFLGARGPSVPYVLGLSQGVFRVARDERTGDRRVMPSPFVGAGPEPQRVSRGDPARRPVPLPEFVALVRNLAGLRP
jgi:hypothetical protein